MKRTPARIAVRSAVAASLVLASFATAGAAIAAPKVKVTICHSAAGKKFVSITVDASAVDFHGHGDHAGDIVPPINGFPGLNWTAQGAATYANGCVPVALADTDKDGVVDLVDKDDDNDAIRDVLDKDDDGDSVPDAVDPDEPMKQDVDGDTIPNALDRDDDGDGIDDAVDPDADGDSVPDVKDDDVTPPIDTDDDSIPDAVDNDDDGDGVPNVEDADANGDGAPEAVREATDEPAPLARRGALVARASECQVVATTFEGTDSDGDGTPNLTDRDEDNDGVPNAVDPDTDGDGVPNGRDGDADGDGRPESVPQAPATAVTLPAILPLEGRTELFPVAEPSPVPKVDETRNSSVHCSPSGQNPTMISPASSSHDVPTSRSPFT